MFTFENDPSMSSLCVTSEHFSVFGALFPPSFKHATYSFNQSTSEPEMVEYDAEFEYAHPHIRWIRFAYQLQYESLRKIRNMPDEVRDPSRLMKIKVQASDILGTISGRWISKKFLLYMQVKREREIWGNRFINGKQHEETIQRISKRKNTNSSPIVVDGDGRELGEPTQQELDEEFDPRWSKGTRKIRIEEIKYFDQQEETRILQLELESAALKWSSYWGIKQ